MRSHIQVSGKKVRTVSIGGVSIGGAEPTLAIAPSASGPGAPLTLVYAISRL